MEFLINRLGTALQSQEEKDCFNEYLLPHAMVLYRSALRLCRNEHDAEDLIQETYYFGLKNFHQVNDREKTKYWLFSILRNLFLKDVEKKKNRVEIEFDAVCEVLHGKENPEKDLIKEEVKNKILDALSSLNDRLKTPVTMFYFESKSYKEISEALDIPIGTVMSRIARAKVHLKRELVRSDSLRAVSEQSSVPQE